MSMFFGLNQGAGAPPAPTTLMQTSFLTSSDVNITGLPMVVGGSWTSLSGTIAAFAAEDFATALGGTCFYVGTGAAEISGSIDMRRGGSDYVAQFVIRCTNANNYWALQLSANAMSIVEVVAGVSTVRATAAKTITQNVWYTSTFTAYGSTITMTHGGTTISYNSATHNQTATLCGLRATQIIYWDNVLVTT